MPPVEGLSFINVLEGDLIYSARFDVGNFSTRTMIGVWKCAPGKFEYTYPGDEICKLLHGEIQLICKGGKVHNYMAGDTFYTRKSDVATWTVIKTVKKIFSIHDPDSTVLSHSAIYPSTSERRPLESAHSS